MLTLLRVLAHALRLLWHRPRMQVPSPYPDESVHVIGPVPAGRR